MAALSPPQQRHEEKESVSLSKMKRQKRKRTKHDPELERFDSLPWNSSLPNEEEDDAFSLFIGSGDLDGGFLSLEEIDESEYGLDVPGDKMKTSNKKTKSKKQKLEEVIEGPGEDAEAEPAEVMAEEKNVMAKKRKRRVRRKRQRVFNKRPVFKKALLRRA
ncbi:hypothetical protein HRI_000877500 [Hibiscus trionum]|uniref:Uncharacterized protein n=1 Tax=Hibiscus trionum TaxID=183268 RepID=A0A9W7H6U8_HIBTR|nr:hypothetical protein HRI_000877500 [Hibiscus trionum]